MEPQTHNYSRYILITLLSLMVIGVGYLGYQDYQLTKAKISLSEELNTVKQDLASTTQALTDKITTLNKLAIDMDSLNQLLYTTQGANLTAEQNIARQQEIIASMNSQVEGMTNTLGLYQKYTSIDRELLSKYSKTFFLNENYTPKNLVSIPSSYTVGAEKQLSSDVWPFMQRLLDDAQAANIDLKITSAFRSFNTQSTLKSMYKVTYGTGANRFSADQGYSEHQLGSTVDFTTTKLGADFSLFEKTESYTWLTNNAYKYGFILSYAKGNSYYIFEPWHWRFIGKALALRLHDENIYFYDLPQRDIDEYLLNIFDK